ncbi:hypothetical protein C8034_v002042 [Colletotrichum sidae]|uniref:Uncharacterized protein n=1 Tax=Colletotrichum sidae TaxID=1347389 RepID=A0A4R8TE03_9PEZI|nr:hypothetical protein C8034_v002042 [Colletotrichum sidae]
MPDEAKAGQKQLDLFQVAHQGLSFRSKPRFHGRLATDAIHPVAVHLGPKDSNAQPPQHGRPRAHYGIREEFESHSRFVMLNSVGNGPPRWLKALWWLPAADSLE